MPTPLQYGMNGADVEDLQRRLNCSSPSRLPALDETGTFGVFTMARVMEFQFNKHLQVDGVCGPQTRGVLPGACNVPVRASARCILVDLVHSILYAYQNGETFLESAPIHGGSASAPSTRGVFPMTDRRLRHHTSSKFPEHPDNMQFAMFYHGGQAIHMGDPLKASHGCIHVGYPEIEKLFNWAGQHDVLVIVVKL